MLLKIRTLFLVLCVAGVAGSCSTSPTSGDGGDAIEGLVMAADGITPIALANVYLESRGASNGGAKSNVKGEYRLTNVPAGTQVVVATKGSFRGTATVIVNGTGVVKAPKTELAPLGKIGYTVGSFDAIQDIVQTLGYTVEAINRDQLNSAAVTFPYSIIFLNCGSGVPLLAGPNLKQWVTAGGTLYASDFEISVIQSIFPTDILTIGFGTRETITANVTDAGLQAFTGKSTVSIAYDLPQWRMLKSISSTPLVLLRANVKEGSTTLNQPLAIEFILGKGKIIFTTFHNEAGVTADQLSILRYFIFS